MAIKVSEKFGNRANPPSSAYPTGSIKDETSPGTSNDGTPLDSDWGNDFEGFKQSVLDEGGVAANGNPDSVLNPQILDAIKSITDDRFNYDGLVYGGVGNISDFAGQQLQETDKTNAYQFPDNSRNFYVADKSQVFPITIPSDPSSDDGWALVNGLTSDSLSNYTDIVYKASGGNSAVENMIAGIPIETDVGGICSAGGDSTYKRISDSNGDISDFEPIWISDNSENNSGYSESSSLVVSGPVTYDTKLKLKNDGSNASAQHNFDVLQNILAGMPNGAEILLPKRGFIKCKSGLDVTSSGVSFVGGNYGGASYDSTWIEFIDGNIDAINLKNYGFTAFAINFRGASSSRGGDVTQDIFNIEMPSVNFDGVFDLCQFSFARNAFTVKNKAARNLKVINSLFSNMQSAFSYSHLGGVDVRDFEFFSNRYHSMGLATDSNAVFDVAAASNVQNLMVQGGHIDDSNLLMRGFAAGLTLDGVQARRMFKGYADIDSSGCSLPARIRKADILNTTHIMSNPANGDTSSALRVNGSMIASIDNFDIMGSGGHGLEINNNSLTDVGKMEIHDAGQSVNDTYDGIHVSSGAVLTQLSGDVSVHQDRFGIVTNKTRYGINNLGADTVFSDEIYVDNMVGREYNSNGQRWRGPAPVGFSSKVKCDYGSAQPSSGVWGVGDYRISTAPAASSAIEKWVCSIAGDFATTAPTFRAVRFT